MLNDVAWNYAQLICDLPAVDDAIRDFVEENTGDNATSIVLAVLEAIASSHTVGEVVADEVEREWNEMWRDIVAPNDIIDISQMKKELADYSMLLDVAGKVYMHVTGGRISKPNTLAEVVCSVADDYMAELFQEHHDDTTQPSRCRMGGSNGC